MWKPGEAFQWMFRIWQNPLVKYHSSMAADTNARLPGNGSLPRKNRRKHPYRFQSHMWWARYRASTGIRTSPSVDAKKNYYYYKRFRQEEETVYRHSDCPWKTPLRLDEEARFTGWWSRSTGVWPKRYGLPMPGLPNMYLKWMLPHFFMSFGATRLLTLLTRPWFQHIRQLVYFFLLSKFQGTNLFSAKEEHYRNIILKVSEHLGIKTHRI